MIKEDKFGRLNERQPPAGGGRLMSKPTGWDSFEAFHPVGFLRLIRRSEAPAYGRCPVSCCTKGGLMNEDYLNSLSPQQLGVQGALAYANNIIATLREPFVVLDKSLRVRTANASYYRTFHVSVNET